MKLELLAWIALLLNLLSLGEARHHFVLVHGAGHGAWCWYKVTYDLERQGHKVDAVDLLSAGTSNTDALTIDSVETYSAPLIKLLESLPAKDKVILVGHSLGGLSLTYAMEKISQRISKAVYVTAFMLPSNATQARSVYNQLNSGASQRIYTPLFRNGSTTPAAASFILENVGEYLYNKSPLLDIVLAKSILKPFPLLDPFVNFTSANYGTVPRYFIKTRHDRTIPLQIQGLMIQLLPPFRVLELNSDHSPFFYSPQLLVKFLLRLANEH